MWGFKVGDEPRVRNATFLSTTVGFLSVEARKDGHDLIPTSRRRARPEMVAELLSELRREALGQVAKGFRFCMVFGSRQSCPSWARTRTLLIQSQACCQLHQGAVNPTAQDSRVMRPLVAARRHCPQDD